MNQKKQKGNAGLKAAQVKRVKSSKKSPGVANAPAVDAGMLRECEKCGRAFDPTRPVRRESWAEKLCSECVVIRLRNRVSELEHKIAEADRIINNGEEAVKLTRDLGRSATGTMSTLAINSLLNIAKESIAALESLAKHHPELVQPIAKNLYQWPGFVSQKRAIKKENEELIDAIKLGEAFRESGWQPYSRSSMIAQLLFGLAEKPKAHIPGLTGKTKREWFEAAWRALLERGIIPEEHKLFAPLGESAIGKKSTWRGMSEQTEAMRRDDMRAEIKRAVWNAFSNLVA